MLGHIAFGYVNSDYFPAQQELFHSLMNITYCFHMPFFFTISGFTFCKSYIDVAGNVKYKKLWRQFFDLMAVYFIFSMAFCLFKLPFGRFVNGPVTIRDLLMIAIEPVGVYWYLYVLLELYLVCAIPNLIRTRLLYLLVASFMACLCSSFCNLTLRLDDAMYYSFFFTIGILIYKKKMPDCNIAVILLFIAAVVLCVVFWNAENTINSITYVNMIVASGITVGIWEAFMRIPYLGENRFLKFCGRYSLEVYVIHSVVVTILRVLLGKFGAGAGISIALQMICGTGVPIIFAMICKRLGIHGLFFKPVSFIREKLYSKT